MFTLSVNETMSGDAEVLNSWLNPWIIIIYYPPPNYNLHWLSPVTSASSDPRLILKKTFIYLENSTSKCDCTINCVFFLYSLCFKIVFLKTYFPGINPTGSRANPPEVTAPALDWNCFSIWINLVFIWLLICCQPDITDKLTLKHWRTPLGHITGHTTGRYPSVWG